MEFLIKRADGDWFDLPYRIFSETLHPDSVSWQAVEGQGDFRIDVLGCEIAFYDEIVGIQVVFEGDSIPEVHAQQLVEEICQNITKATGQSGEVVQTA